jgi:hypothetical protein
MFDKQRVVARQTRGKAGHRLSAKAAMQDATSGGLRAVLAIKQRGGPGQARGHQIKHGRLKAPLQRCLGQGADLMARNMKTIR